LDGYSPVVEVHIKCCGTTEEIASKMTLHITGLQRR